MAKILKSDPLGILSGGSIDISGSGHVAYDSNGNITTSKKTRLISGRTIGRADVKNGGSINADRTYIAKFDSLSFINCYPPPANSLVDPPPILSENDINTPLQQFEDILGRDYVERVLMKGQYLVLVPLELVPSFAKMAKDKVSPLVKLDNIMNRLDLSSYGYSTNVNIRKYNRAVTALMQSALLALGFDLSSTGSINAEFDKNFFPEHIVQKMYKSSSGYMDPFDGILGNMPDVQNKNAQNGISAESNESGADVASNFLANLEKSEAKMKGNLESASDMLGAVANSTYSLNSSAAMNIIKFITNIDSSDAVNASLPWSIYYINGTVSRSFTTNSNIDESLISKSITDIGAKMAQGITENTKSGNAASNILNQGGITPEMLKEAAYHDMSLVGGVSGFLVENTYIPSVIRSTMLNVSYNIPLKQVCAGSDPYSLFRPLYVLAQLLPYVIPTNAVGSAMMVPEAPMYCAAFVKGVMNLPKAAITQMSINTNTAYQTSEGIPLELDINLTITPLQTMSTMPNFDGIFNGNMDKSRVIAQMFNPLSPFNIIATLAGQNTVLSKFPYGLFRYFVYGTVSRFFTALGGAPQYISDGISDFYASSLTQKSRILSLR